MNDDLFNDLLDLAGDDFHDEPERTVYQRAAFGMPGGKNRSLKHLLPIIQPYVLNHSWIDHFGGTGVVSFNIAHICNNKVFNDRYSGITSFYRCLRDHKDELLNELKMFPSASREQWLLSRESWCNTTDPIKRAAHWYYMVRLSVAGKGTSFGRAFNVPYLPMQGSLEVFGKLSTILKEFVLENLDFRQSMKDYNHPERTHLIDPPYLHTDPGVYEYKWKQDDLTDLLNLIPEMKGTVILTHYPNEMIDGQDYWDERHSWDVTVTSEVQSYTKENNRPDGVPGMGQARECLWIKEAR